MSDRNGKNGKIRVLVVDDSALMRKLIPKMLTQDPEIEIVATAMDGIFALKKIRAAQPDVITLDLDMPRMDGLTLLPLLTREFQIPVLVVSSLTARGADMTFRALELGAVDFVTKPQDAISVQIEQVGSDLINKVKSIARIPKSKVREAAKESSPPPVKKDLIIVKGEIHRIVAIGISTGGPIALARMLPHFPPDFPAGLVIVQHMPKDFTRMFAHRLNQISRLEVKEAEDGDVVRVGHAFIAPGDAHLKVKRIKTGCIAVVGTGPPICGHRPSADVLFDSVADEFGSDAIGVIMTGMGEDGARGITGIKDRGGLTIAQDQETSIVFGMPKMAIKYGGIERVLPLDEIVPALETAVGYEFKRAEPAQTVRSDGMDTVPERSGQGGVL